MAHDGFVDYWSTRLSRHEPQSRGWTAEGIRCLNAADRELPWRGRSEIIERVRQEALRKRKDRPLRGGGATLIWIDEVAQVDTDAVRSLHRSLYGRSAVEQVLGSLKRENPWRGLYRRYESDLFNYSKQAQKFNNDEGEKAMQKIDWHKPLRCTKPNKEEAPQVATFKSSKQRVVWIGDFVYPVDEQGRAVAAVDYGFRGPYRVRCALGQQLVDNVPEEEKFFLGLARNTDGTYWLTDGGTVSERGAIANYWSGLMKGTPHWIVDTRKSAEPPKAIEHDPKDWTVVRVRSGGETESFGMMAKAQAEAKAARVGGYIVRVRTTPAPADTARYVQLWRRAGTDRPWSIDGRDANGVNRQEYAWKDTLKTGHCGNEYVHVKVRD